MDQEKRTAQTQDEAGRLAGETPAKRPARYSLYDKAKINIPLKVMDIVIWAIVGLIVLAAVVGMILP